jgi:hypothetical protein
MNRRSLIYFERLLDKERKANLTEQPEDFPKWLVQDGALR